MRAAALALSVCAGVLTLTFWAADILVLVLIVLALFAGGGWWPVLWAAVAAFVAHRLGLPAAAGSQHLLRGARDREMARLFRGGRP